MIAIRRLDAFLARIEQWLLALILLAMVLLSVAQILLRNLAGTSWFWIDPFNRMLVLWLAILGAMVATRSGEHIAIDALKHYLSGLPAALVERLATGFACFVSGLMAWHSTRFVYDEYVFNTPAFAGLPAWPFELIMPLGFGLMAWRFGWYTLAGQRKTAYE